MDIDLTKDSSLLHHAIHRLSTGGFLKKTRLHSGIKIHTKICETRKLENKLEFINEYLLVERKNEGRKPDKNSSLRRLKLKPIGTAQFSQM